MSYDAVEDHEQAEMHVTAAKDRFMISDKVYHELAYVLCLVKKTPTLQEIVAAKKRQSTVLDIIETNVHVGTSCCNVRLLGFCCSIINI